MTRVCVKCGEDKPLSEYPASPRSRDGHERRCKTCRAKWRRDYAARPEVAARITRQSLARTPAQIKHTNLVRMYGITLAEYEARLEAQGHRCPVCSGELDGGKHTHVDHCHAANTVRGLLCGTCNRGLGQFQDDPALLRAGAAYIEEHTCPNH